ncbi:UPF0692 protein C19orf54 [Portunus trituberculatus]|uniref:Actin maturation protease n=1 Tax=Portunus trituberculatus TaxID=210409 RepID=A0A5B7CF49_PORTR|nr:UPF0692 protein C19orf54 [Portunus trituberculatus]
METSPTSPPIPHFPNISPSPPPPPPSYSISELPAADLPPPPPHTLWQEITSPCYMCCYDPPSPEVKSEYDPKLPPGFSSTPDIFPSSPPLVHPPPPPNPPVLHMSGVSSSLHNVSTFSDLMASHSKSTEESPNCENYSLETCSSASLASSSTLTAADFQTQDSDLSSLPPHDLRVSPLSTDTVTLSSQVSIGSITPSRDVSLTPSFLSASHEYMFCSNTSELLTQASVLMDTFHDTSLSSDPLLSSSFVALKSEHQGSSTQTPGPYRRMESIKSEDGSFVPSEVSYSTTDTAGPAIMSSPLSTDIPSIPSLPTDLDSVSSGFGSLTTDTWSFSTEVDSQLEDASTIRTKTNDFTAADAAESETVSFTGSITITPVPSDNLTPHFATPPTTPVHSSLPSSPLPYLSKSESFMNLDPAKSQDIVPSISFPTVDGEFSSLSLSTVPKTQTDQLEYSSSCHGFTTSYQSHSSDLLSSQPPSCQGTEQCINHTKDNSTSLDILSESIQLGLEVNSSVQRTSYDEKTGRPGMPHSTTLQENELSDQVTQVTLLERNTVMQKEEIKNTNEVGNIEPADEQRQGGSNNNVGILFEGQDNLNGRVSEMMICRENDDSHVMKDVNGNISYLDLESGHETQLENKEDMSEVESIGIQTMKDEGEFERNTKDQGNMSEVLSSHSSLMASDTYSIIPSSPGISCSGTLNLSPKTNLVSQTVRNTLYPSNGKSTSTCCSPASSEIESCRVAQVSSVSPKGPMDLLNAMVMDLENISADLPVSTTSRPLDLSRTAPVSVLSIADQVMTHTPTSSKIPDGNHEELKMEDCHLTKSFLPHPSPTNSTSTIPTLSSHNLPPTTTVSSHACMTEYSSNQSNYGDHTNMSLFMNDNSESASKEVLLGSCLTDKECGMPLPSLCSSPKPSSLLDGQPSPSPAPRPRTPPTPPPRSCHNTPRSHLVPPLPPVRQYMLVPINIPRGASRQPSPPPAPPRSTSVHKSSPPPPPRPSAPLLPSSVLECNKGPPLPPLPFSSCITPQPALTPVPEESSNPQSPVLPKSLHFGSPICEGIISQTVPPPDSLPTSQQLSSVPQSLSSSGSENPPALPPPPEDEQEDEDLPPPPPPPPLIESDEAAPALPLPPPPSHILLSPSKHSSTQGKDELSSTLCPQQKPALPGSSVVALHTNQSSTPSSDSDLPAPTVDEVANPPPPKISSVITSSPMSNSLALDAANASSLPLIPPTLHAPPSYPPLPPCAPEFNMEKTAKSPLITTSPYGKMVVVRSDLPLPTPEEEVRVTFSAAKDWGFLAAYEDTLSVYTQLRPVIQQGPQCGLVALSMASQVFPQTVEVEELLETGRAMGFTRHGEMFSTTALAQLAEKTVIGLQAEVRRDVLSSPATLLQLLLQGDLVLVPYDAERNHQPGLKNGHKAHWGVVCGCLVQSSSLTFPTAAAKLDSHVDNLWHLRPRSRAGRSRSITPCPPALSGSPMIGQRSLKALDRTGGCEGNPSSVSCSRVSTPMLSELRHDDELRLVALWRQGKSRKVVAAPLDQLCESNDQLVSYPPPATPQELEYMVQSVQEGLAGQVVVLHKTKAALSDLVGLLQEK